jgi:predicted nucleic acid-binding protein
MIRLGVPPFCARTLDAMARYVIDAPTLLHLVDTDLSINPAHQLVAPNSIRSEALQLLLSDVRRGERTERAALGSHARMTALKMRLLGDRVSRGMAWRIALEHGWDTLRDAEYLAITRLQGDALVTVDARLAARADTVVPVAPIEALSTGG